MFLIASPPIVFHLIPMLQLRSWLRKPLANAPVWGGLRCSDQDITTRMATTPTRRSRRLQDRFGCESLGLKRKRMATPGDKIFQVLEINGDHT